MSKQDHDTTIKDQLQRGIAGNVNSVLNIVIVGIIIATLFTAATPSGMLSGSFAESLITGINAANTPTPEWATPTPRPRPRIGIVVGHWGDDNDPGAVCPDGLTELSINQDVAAIVQQNLKNEGFDIDLLKEFDPILNGYQALALVSIHADSCNYINDQATGFKVAASMNSRRPDKTARLTACIRNRYALATQMKVHIGITPDMSSYHAFDEINDDTPAVIIETGFMNLDRQILTQQPDLVAEGITNGILCYLYNEDISNPAVDEPNE
jgi:N-acetylmuramoyl-L-alanine amidase